MSWLIRFVLANWSNVFHVLLLTMALLCGIQIGQSRVQKVCDAEKQKIAQAQARQEQHVADVRISQSQITQEISHEFAKRSKLLADRLPDTWVGGVCNVSTAGSRDMPAVSENPARAASTGPDPLPAPDGDEREVTCAQLIKDASQTTLMLLEMQRWYQKQSAVDP
jgi:hypothetical protein